MTKANWYIRTHTQTNRVIKNGEGCGAVVMHVYPKEFKYRFKKKNFACHGKHIWKLPAGQACLPFDLARSLLLTNEKIGPESDSVRLLWLVGARTKIESRSSSILCRTFSLTTAGFSIWNRYELKIRNDSIELRLLNSLRRDLLIFFHGNRFNGKEQILWFNFKKKYSKKCLLSLTFSVQWTHHSHSLIIFLYVLETRENNKVLKS